MNTGPRYTSFIRPGVANARDKGGPGRDRQPGNNTFSSVHHTNTEATGRPTNGIPGSGKAQFGSGGTSQLPKQQHSSAYHRTESLPKLNRMSENYHRALTVWRHISDLDEFLQEVYEYYERKGFYYIAWSKSLNILAISVAIFCMFRPTFHFLLLILFTAWYYCIFTLLAFPFERLRVLQQFYTQLLGISDSELQTIPWAEVVRRIQLLQDHSPITFPRYPTADVKPIAPKLDLHDIASRIMRRENYLIAMLDHKILDLQNLEPGLLERAFLSQGPRRALTRVLGWNLRRCIVAYFFDWDKVNEAPLKEEYRKVWTEGLKWRMWFFGVMNFALIPFTLMYLLVDITFLRYFKLECQRTPSSLGSREYTPFARWKFREYNELPHILDQRLEDSYSVASEYIDRFPGQWTGLITSSISIISGLSAAVMFVLSIADRNRHVRIGSFLPKRGTDMART